MRTKNPNTLLIIRLDSIGDYILFRNFLSELRNDYRYKNYKITLCGNIVWKNLAENFDNNIIDDFIWIDRDLFLRSISYKYKILKTIYKKGFEKAVETIHSREILFGDIIVKASRARERIGCRMIDRFSKLKKNIFSDHFYTKLIPVDKPVVFEFERNKEFFDKLLSRDINIIRPELDLTMLRDQKKSNGKYIVIHPGASRPNKVWNIKNFKEVTKFILLNYSVDIFVTGSIQEAYMFTEMCSPVCKDRFISFFGNSLTDLARLILGAELLISNDTGTVHIAAAVNTPFVCIANGNLFGRFIPYPKEIFDKGFYVYPTVIMEQIDNYEYLAEQYRFGSDLDINEIKPEKVIEAISQALNNLT